MAGELLALGGGGGRWGTCVVINTREWDTGSSPSFSTRAKGVHTSAFLRVSFYPCPTLLQFASETTRSPRSTSSFLKRLSWSRLASVFCGQAAPKDATNTGFCEEMPGGVEIVLWLGSGSVGNTCWPAGAMLLAPMWARGKLEVMTLKQGWGGAWGLLLLWLCFALVFWFGFSEASRPTEKYSGLLNREGQSSLPPTVGTGLRRGCPCCCHTSDSGLENSVQLCQHKVTYKLPPSICFLTLEDLLLSVQGSCHCLLRHEG